MSIPPGADLEDGYATDDWPMEGTMTSHNEQEHSVANPDRTVLDDNDTTDERVHDQDWPEVAKEVKEAAENADGPLD